MKKDRKDKVVNFYVKKVGSYYAILAHYASGKWIQFKRKTYDGVIYKLDIAPSKYRSVKRKDFDGLYYVIKPQLVYSRKAKHAISR